MQSTMLGRSRQAVSAACAKSSSTGTKWLAICAPISGPHRNASGPASATLCEIVLPLPFGVISQMNVIVVPGGPPVLILSPRCGTTSVKVTACLLPRDVVIVPVAPDTSGPLIVAEAIPLFQRLQLFGSDQTVHTRSGEAVVERDFPYVFMLLHRPSEKYRRSRRLTYWMVC